MMSEEKFFQKVQSELSGYSPEVPAHVYAGMRRKYGWAKFTTWNATKWNVWYLVMLLGISTGIAYSTTSSLTTESIQAKRGLATPVEAPVLEAVNATLPVACESNHTAACSSSSAACASAKTADRGSNANEATLSQTTPAVVETNVSASANNSDLPEITEQVNPIQEETTPEVLDVKPKKKLKVNVYKARN
jgi:hypothetical protein